MTQRLSLVHAGEPNDGPLEHTPGQNRAHHQCHFRVVSDNVAQLRLGILDDGDAIKSATTCGLPRLLLRSNSARQRLTRSALGAFGSSMRAETFALRVQMSVSKEPGSTRYDLNADRLQFKAQRLRPAFERELRRCITADAGKSACGRRSTPPSRCARSPGGAFAESARGSGPLRRRNSSRTGRVTRRQLHLRQIPVRQNRRC